MENQGPQEKMDYQGHQERTVCRGHQENVEFKVGIKKKCSRGLYLEIFIYLLMTIKQARITYLAS